jgi:hypothetical protein
MSGIGAEPTGSDRMVFKALAHVDDILYSGTNDAICEEFFKQARMMRGKLSGGLIAEVILGIRVVWDDEKCTVTLSQRAHVEKFLDEFGFQVPEERNELRRGHEHQATGTWWRQQ